MAVVVFEVVLNATAMFNHSNVRMPVTLDRLLRLVVVTPDMHRVHLLDDGVEVGRHGHRVPEGAVNIEELLGKLMECGLHVSACGMALKDCSIDESAMLPGIECGSMKTLANWVKESDHVVVF